MATSSDFGHEEQVLAFVTPVYFPVKIVKRRRKYPTADLCKFALVASQTMPQNPKEDGEFIQEYFIESPLSEQIHLTETVHLHRGNNIYPGVVIVSLKIFAITLKGNI